MIFNNRAALLDAALDYARRGWHVLPLHGIVDGVCTCGRSDCHSPGKHPRTPRGLLDATADEAVIRQWWSQWPAANIGLRTGDVSGFVVIDVDGAAGIAAMEDLERQHGDFPGTVRSITGGGGRHIFFKAEPRNPVGNAVRLHGVPIDCRGENGYVVAPPSRHASGQAYVWDHSPDEIPVADIPGWLAEWLQDTHGRAPAGENGVTATGLVLTVEADDLQTAPGAAEGQRNDTLCRLVGRHLTRGESLADIEQAAIAWAERCTPPLPSDETRRTVQGLANRHASRNIPSPPNAPIIAPADQLDAIPLPAEKHWPRLHADALYGLAGDVVRRIEPVTEADPAALLTQFLVQFGVALGRTAYCQVEEDKHYGNLFTVLLGQSAAARKGTSAGRIRRLFPAEVDGTKLGAPKSTGLSSGEGLIALVRDPVAPSVARDGSAGPALPEEVPTDKRRLIEEPEFGGVLKVVRRDGNTLSAIVRNAWDTGNLETLTKNNPLRATGAHIAIIGHCTWQELLRYLHETEIANGFANRFLWVAVRRSKLLAEGGIAVDVDDLILRVAEAVRFAQSTERVDRDNEARSLWRASYPRLSAARFGMFGAVTSRAEAQVLRLSLLYAMLDRSPVVRVPHLMAAMAFWRYCEDSARLVFGDSTGNEDADKVLATIRATPGCTRSDIHREFNNHLPAKRLVEILAELRDAGLVIVDQDRQTGGRPLERWYPAGHFPIGEDDSSTGRPDEHSLCSLNSQFADASAGSDVAPAEDEPQDAAPPAEPGDDCSPPERPENTVPSPQQSGAGRDSVEL